MSLQICLRGQKSVGLLSGMLWVNTSVGNQLSKGLTTSSDVNGVWKLSEVDVEGEHGMQRGTRVEVSSGLQPAAQPVWERACVLVVPLPVEVGRAPRRECPRFPTIFKTRWKWFCEQQLSTWKRCVVAASVEVGRESPFASRYRYYNIDIEE